jgi:hypothetical protein
MTTHSKIDRDLLIEKGFLTPLKRGRKPLYQSADEASESKLRHCRLANSKAYQRFKEARARYLESLRPDTLSEPDASEPCTS